jgi:NitT/TauT family transport system substrate-binding protein
MLRRSVPWTLLAAASLVPALVACGPTDHHTGRAAPGTSASGSGHATVTLAVSGLGKQIFLPFRLAQELGFFEKYGVTVRLVDQPDDGPESYALLVDKDVDMVGGWYNRAVELVDRGTRVEVVAQLSGAPGERILCAPTSGVRGGADFRGKRIGVTALGAGTDTLTKYVAAKAGVAPSDYETVAVGVGDHAVAALREHRVDCVITTQPTVTAIESAGLGQTVVDLASFEGTKKALAALWPSTALMARTSWVEEHPEEVQSVVDAMVATMHWISTHSAAEIADRLPPEDVASALVTREEYVAALAGDKGQFLPDALMPAGGPKTVLDTLIAVGAARGLVDLSTTFTNSFVLKALQDQGITATSTPAAPTG